MSITDILSSKQLFSEHVSSPLNISPQKESRMQTNARRISMLDKENSDVDSNKNVDDRNKRARLTSPIKATYLPGDADIASILGSPSFPRQAFPVEASTTQPSPSLPLRVLPFAASPTTHDSETSEENFIQSTLKRGELSSPRSFPPGSPSLAERASRRRSAPESTQPHKDSGFLSRTPASAPPQRRPFIVLPKVNRDEQGDFLVSNNTRYELQALAIGIYCRHQVYIARTEKKEFVLKAYHHILNKRRQSDMMYGDFVGHQKIKDYLAKHECPGFRLADIYTNPKTDGILLMEYVKGDNEFWKEWKETQSMQGLSEKAVTILTIARNLIESMWKTKTDLGDFRAVNVIWEGNRMAQIDWENDSEEAENDDQFRNKLMLIVDEWALGNEGVKNFLIENLK